VARDQSVSEIREESVPTRASGLRGEGRREGATWLLPLGQPVAQWEKKGKGIRGLGRPAKDQREEKEGMGVGIWLSSGRNLGRGEVFFLSLFCVKFFSYKPFSNPI